MATATQTTVRANQRAGTSPCVRCHAFRTPRAACLSGFSGSKATTAPPSESTERTPHQREPYAFARSTAFPLPSISRDRAVSHPDLTHSPDTAARCNIVTSAPLVTGPRKINRQLSGTSSSANLNSPITNNAPSNRQWQILEFTVTHTKQTTAPRSNRHFLRCLNLQIQHSQKFCRTRTALEGLLSTLDLQPSPFVSNRNNTSFKIPGNSLTINAERNPNRNTNRELRVAPRHPLITNAPFLRNNFHAGLGRRIP